MQLLTYAYAVLAFAETLVLFASIVGLLVFAVRQAVRIINRFIDAAIDTSSRERESRTGRQSRLAVAGKSGFYRIPGGHNERF